jgi:hypothetical protein
MTNLPPVNAVTIRSYQNNSLYMQYSVKPLDPYTFSIHRKIAPFKAKFFDKTK